MPSQEEVDALTQRIAELEAELAEAKAAQHVHPPASEDTDTTWGEFNPG